MIIACYHTSERNILKHIYWWGIVDIARIPNAYQYLGGLQSVVGQELSKAGDAG